MNLENFIQVTRMVSALLQSWSEVLNTRTSTRSSATSFAPTATPRPVAQNRRRVDLVGTWKNQFVSRTGNYFLKNSHTPIRRGDLSRAGQTGIQEYAGQPRHVSWPARTRHWRVREIVELSSSRHGPRLFRRPTTSVQRLGWSRYDSSEIPTMHPRREC